MPLFRFSLGVLALCLTSDVAVSLTSKASEDLITDLPGSEGMPFTNMFAGYLDLPGTQKHVFYWYVEAVEDPASAPVALWTNGGPGCSGLTGFMTEQGPFRIGSDGQLQFNQYAWNKAANMLFIEQPVGVGFSYSDDRSDYSTGDYQAAQDNYAAILQFMNAYPDLKDNNFYITAESYGGHYMPTLAKTIVDNDPDRNAVNFRGFAVGNPYTSTVSNNVGEFKTLYGHQVVSKKAYDSWEANCGAHYGEQKDFELDGQSYDLDAKPLRCVADETNMLARVEKNLNPYALDFPTCPHSFGEKQRMAFKAHQEGKLLEEIEAEVEGTIDGYEPCTDDYATTYLNRFDVQAAIHATPADATSATRWSECSYSLRYNHSDSRTPMMPIYEFLLDRTNEFDLDILVYSGDDDVVCATIGSQEWIYDLGFDTQDLHGWRAWKYMDDNFGKQTGGFQVNFDKRHMSGNFAFVTAHGCGHEVPTYKPQLALEIFRNYLSGEVFETGPL